MKNTDIFFACVMGFLGFVAHGNGAHVLAFLFFVVGLLSLLRDDHNDPDALHS